MNTRRFHSRSILRDKPEGGYRRIANAQICMIWRAYKSRLLPKFYDVRVYFALHEVAETFQMNRRMRDQEPGRENSGRVTPDLVYREVYSIVRGLNRRLIVASVQRLERAGLVALTETAITFAADVNCLSTPEIPGFEEMWHALDGRETVRARSVPIPRRMLRYIARSGSAGSVATLLGHAVRCLWLRANMCSFAGHCSAGYLADVFDIDIRTVKRARAMLSSGHIAWLIPLPTSQRARRHGALMAINPQWGSRVESTSDRSDSLDSRSELSPQTTVSSTALSPPKKNRDLRRSGTNQNRNPGVDDRRRNSERTTLLPRLNNLTLSDLEDVRRRQRVMHLARESGWIGKSESDRLRLFAAAEHALRLGASNPCGLFVAVVRRGLWHHISNETEDIARRKLQAIDTLATVSWDASQDPISNRRQASRTTIPGQSAPAPIPTQIGSRVGDLVARVASHVGIAGSEPFDRSRLPAQNNHKTVA